MILLFGLVLFLRLLTGVLRAVPLYLQVKRQVSEVDN